MEHWAPSYATLCTLPAHTPAGLHVKLQALLASVPQSADADYMLVLWAAWPPQLRGGVGMATVSKRNWTTQHGEKRSARVVSYYDRQGKQHRPQFRTKREAEDERVRVEGELAEGVHVADRDSVTVLVAAQAFLADFEGLVRAGKRERSTLDAYRRHVVLHIASFAISDIKLAHLTGPTCLAYANDLEATRTMGRRALSTLRSILDFATSHGWCRANPAKSVQIRTATREEASGEEGESYFPTRSEIRQLLNAADQRDDHGMAAALVRLLCFCGLRASEVRALRRQDLDFARRRIHVRQRADAWQRLGPCKSRAGRRTIPLPPDTMAALKRWVLAAPLSPLDLVFPTSIGSVQSYANLYHRFWVPLMAVAELVERSGEDGAVVRPNFALHALRHVACSLWIELGANAKQVQTWAGHASVQFTLDRYGHIWEGSVSDSNIASMIERSVGD